MVEYFKEKGNQYLISYYYQNNLYDYVKKSLTEKTIKGIMKQIITVVGFLHSKNYVHRDIKPDNILLDSKGNIKLTDFDLTRIIPENNDKPLTRNVVTLYYRAPEIFFGDVHYGKSIDIWSIGCVFAEMFLGEPLFKGGCELETLGKIINIVGNPNEDNWPGVKNLPNFLPYEKVEPTLTKMFETKMSKEGIDLLGKLLTLNPLKRISCEDALKLDYFKGDISTPEEIAKELGLK